MSSLRRSAPSIHRQIRSISVPPSSLIATSVNSTGPNSHDKNPSLLRWVSAVVAGAGIAASVYWYSSSVSSTYTVKSAMSFADRLMATADRIKKSYEGQSLSSSNFFIRDTLRRRIFFNYEKRLRMLSPPEKVFEYFASIKNARGETLMTPGDLMRAIVPVFPPSESGLVRDGSLRGERLPGELHCAPSEFFMLFDLNNDGLISFKEYIFFVTLLSIPESSFSVAFKMFDIDNDGEIDREEFKKVMALMRGHNRQGALQKGGRRTGLKVNGHVENGGLVHYFFGEDGHKGLRHDKFVQFLRDLHDEMIWLEFSHYDYKSRGTISAKDFVLSMVASGDIRHMNRLLDRVDELDNEPHLKEIRITFEEFKNFARLRKKLQPFSLALFSYGKVNGFLTRKDFQRAASQVCDVELSNNVIELIFHLFDANQDGNLCSDEFLRVMHRRERETAQVTQSGIMNTF
ncbi:calcium uptake protein, mitochondrial-like isoform X1 [Cynara cardunculus var. scolymus]|uniref:calcium uptake protein, mitochondrial-like isoform X1 n=1 Tax=Cynara cardunculus var. scolymus TaxID=59895 RepID=UPI000D628CB2|nr:calcium uptake protein, mitochondrial-like isoform X1 [Cynara cardunculus var. scolymus]